MLVYCSLLLLLAFEVYGQDSTYTGHRLHDRSLVISTTDGRVTLTAYGAEAMAVFYERDHLRQLPSYAIADTAVKTAGAVRDRGAVLEYATPELRAVIRKRPFTISFYKDRERLLAEETGFFAKDTIRGFRFSLGANEKLLGGGQRVLGMDRRGHRLPLYNQGAYGYTTEAKQMYFGLPAVMSSKKYILLFDNAARGFMDLGKSEADVLQFEAVGGRTSYIVVAGDTYPELIENYVSVTGKQPLPPRWAFGNYASRFGYRSEAQARATVQKFADEDFPLDAIIFDLYWFGPDIKGHMGNLAWDKKAFPTPQKMIADFKRRGVNTILITEPFVLTTSKRWEEAVAANALALNPGGKPKRFDFYFGNTGLIDVFDPKAGDWFWSIYRGLMEQGVEGWWGDLGEPEVHPPDTLHAAGTAEEIHNAYGHRWAELLFTRHRQAYPDKRPFIMMRSGFAGSQRYGMVPWTGDVSRSWDGLKPQVELALQMGLLGLGYIHSDLGGFAGGETFDKEMYIRWLQYGVFQPIYRPHAQDNIAPEPVFHDRETRDILREYVKLRYRLLPYNYTLAYHNATTGLPLMRPLFFEDESDPELMDYKDAFLWGDAFLVAPVVDPNLDSVAVRLPAGVWFDYWTGASYQGGGEVDVPVSLQTIPVLVRAGAFVPMIDAIATTRDYSSQRLALHYYAHSSVPEAQAMMYEDDGKTHGAIEKGLFEIIDFAARQRRDSIEFTLGRTSGGYPGMPEVRAMMLTVHNWHAPVQRAFLGDKTLPFAASAAALESTPTAAYHDTEAGRLLLKFAWDGKPLKLGVN
ncbi:DUF5110 domain-containing protein [Exilibacterium tricleocarpae]|uniref:DUF5110 domain-containing protein n=1 Tax=Exilibacterium tricleocarpae TaxID=2591008 RepID=A0A545SQS6_9GAMM|nr:DUF5110 domain-containing protein [Exilibacterium tricleocarpae]